ncbi:hypothetical protein EUX98_g3107 [Antrodiella citrinella]|uniref:Protein kinase domain-containing protein n=1 Tax=Antrodiella citrinella TaxID=2447956 RepID=A0A4S4MZY2_9APHY|nr:hypothetical protein EUX98_g3107 [Antrodiella citrinella]
MYEDTEYGICMVIPWAAHGSVNEYLTTLRENGAMSKEALPPRFNKWLCHVALGLEYLHQEKIVHGNLHCGSIVIDVGDNALLTDYGLGVLPEASPLNYASTYGGGGFTHRAPELHDPEVFGMTLPSLTPRTDVYAFACTAVELYTGKPLFGIMSFYEISITIVSGRRPQRPTERPDSPEVNMSDSMWFLTQQCWKQEPGERPIAQDVTRDMDIIASGQELVQRKGKKRSSNEYPPESSDQASPFPSIGGCCQCLIA